MAVMPIVAACRVKDLVLHERDEFGKAVPCVTKNCDQHAPTKAPCVGNDVNMKKQTTKQCRDHISEQPLDRVRKLRRNGYWRIEAMMVRVDVLVQPRRVEQSMRPI